MTKNDEMNSLSYTQLGVLHSSRQDKEMIFLNVDNVDKTEESKQLFASKDNSTPQVLKSFKSDRSRSALSNVSIHYSSKSKCEKEAN